MDSFEVSTRPQDILFGLIVSFATYIAFLGMKPPNPSPALENRAEKDTLMMGWSGKLLIIHRTYFLISGLLQALFAVLHPIGPSILCPAPEQMRPILFQWNWYTVPLTAMMILGGAIRITAYRQLGSNFTYELATPSGLITSGLYKYVQHPSYTGGMLMGIGMVPMIGRFDGSFSCFVPSPYNTGVSIFTTSYYGLLTVILLFAFPLRILEEEAMMRKAFSKEFKQYQENTSRFVPGIF